MIKHQQKYFQHLLQHNPLYHRPSTCSICYNHHSAKIWLNTQLLCQVSAILQPQKYSCENVSVWNILSVQMDSRELDYAGEGASLGLYGVNAKQLLFLFHERLVHNQQLTDVSVTVLLSTWDQKVDIKINWGESLGKKYRFSLWGLEMWFCKGF